MFEINYDLRFIGYSHIQRNGKLIREYRYCRRMAATFVLSIILGSLYHYGILIAYGIMTLFNIIDGFKIWHYKFTVNPDKSLLSNVIRRLAFYGRKFSLQYFLIWDIGGALVAGLMIELVKRI